MNLLVLGLHVTRPGRPQLNKCNRKGGHCEPKIFLTLLRARHRRAWWLSSPDPWFGGILQTSGCVCFLGEGTQSFRKCLDGSNLHGNRSQPTRRFTSGGSGESRTPKEVATTNSRRGNGEARENILIPKRTRLLRTGKGAREKGNNNRRVELEEIILERGCVFGFVLLFLFIFIF